jgi:hypothetical protein
MKRQSLIYLVFCLAARFGFQRGLVAFLSGQSEVLTYLVVPPSVEAPNPELCRVSVSMVDCHWRANALRKTNTQRLCSRTLRFPPLNGVRFSL